jgi:hypothetical protein
MIFRRLGDFHLAFEQHLLRGIFAFVLGHSQAVQKAQMHYSRTVVNVKRWGILNHQALRLATPVTLRARWVHNASDCGTVGA